MSHYLGDSCPGGHKDVADMVGEQQERKSTMKYRKKPVVVEAIWVSELLAKRNITFGKNDMPAWVNDAFKKGVLSLKDDNILIKTIEGTMTAGEADWIICGIQGELYPCKPDIFDATYEAVKS